MPAGSLLLLLDDIASALDDIAAMTKVAASKTAAVVGDDLALNANQLTGVAADRELKVVGAVALGSLRNKLILVPAALLISAYVPVLVAPLLVIGGCYLCFEGAEKLAHRVAAGGSDGESANHRPVRLSEAERIAGAVRTDFVLSAEIIVIAMGAVAGSPVIVRVGVLSAVALGMTVGVYGLVAVIVKLDDAGLFLSRLRGPAPAVTIPRLVGRLLLSAAPVLMRLLAVAGTAAMFMVGGGILAHAIEPLHAWVTSAPLKFGLSRPGALGARAVLDGLIGTAAGLVLVLGTLIARRLRPR
jgi:uncharacterized protein